MTDTPDRNELEDSKKEIAIKSSAQKTIRQTIESIESVEPVESNELNASDTSDAFDASDDFKAMERQLDFEGMIVEFAAQLLRMPISGYEASLDPWLKRFAETLDVDRVSLMDFPDASTHGIFYTQFCYARISSRCRRLSTAIGSIYRRNFKAQRSH